MGLGENASLMIMSILQNMLYFGNFNDNPTNSFSLVKWQEWLKLCRTKLS